MPDSTDKAQVITTRLHEILDKVDMQITSERQIINKLAEELGDDVYDHKALIKSKINDFISTRPGEAGTEENDAVDVEQHASPPNKKRKHDVDAPGASDARKIDTGESEELQVDLTGSRKVTVSKFKGKLYVGIREYYSKNGEQAPGKGISLDPPQWAHLAENIDAISQAIQDDDTEFLVKLNDLRQVSVQHYKGRMQVGIREMYMKDNELLPGRKGIALSIEQWEELCKAAADVTQAIQNGGGKPQAKESSQPASKASAVTDAATSSAAAPASAPDAITAAPSASAQDNSAAPSAAAQNTSAAADAAATDASPGAPVQLPIQLSAVRKADISPFKGVVYVNIREFYEKGMCKTVKSADRALVDKLKAYYVLQKDGKQSPGKKGISLPADQFHLLRNVSSNLTEALESRNKSFEVQLSGKRKASISIFKDKAMVDIREFYEKDGEQRPGSKGISLPPEQWHKLAAGFDALAAALQAQS